MAEQAVSTKYSSLREWMLADDALDASVHPLIRLGALYHLEDRLGDEEVIKRIKNILEEADRKIDL